MTQTARLSLILASLSASLLACDGQLPSNSDLSGPAPQNPETAKLIMSRPYKYKVPKDYDPKKPTPLVVMQMCIRDSL